MKRIVSTILVALLFIGCAFAETIDFSGMTDTELVELYNAVREEMTLRNINGAEERTLREGKYIIGRDIPAGDYTITCIGTAGESLGSAYGSLGDMAGAVDGSEDWGALFGSSGGMMEDYIDMSIEIIGDYGDVLHSYSMKTGDNFTITLEEDTALQVSNGSCTIKKN